MRNTAVAETTSVRSLNSDLMVGVLGIAILFGGIGIWAAKTSLSSALIANGVLVVEGNAKKVQHPTGGIVERLLVKEGQSVDEGQILIKLDTTVIAANLAAASESLDYLLARRARLEAERDGLDRVKISPAIVKRLAPERIARVMANERQLFNERRSARDGQKARFGEQAQQFKEEITGLDIQQVSKGEEIDLVEKELIGLRNLFGIGGITMSQVNSLERNAARLRGERGQLIASIASTRGRISEIELQRLQIDQAMRAEVAEELRDSGNEELKLIEQEVTAQNQLAQSVIRAPIDGVVQQLAFHTVGGVITLAETVMVIVPQHSRLNVEARIAPKDIDQLAIGQKAMLRMTAFNRNTTPEIEGSIVQIPVDLEIDKQTGESFYRTAISIHDVQVTKISGLKLVAGMPVEVFLRTGDRSVASYFLKPFRDHLHHAFRQE